MKKHKNKTTHRLLAVFLAALLCMSSLCPVALAAEPNEPESGINETVSESDPPAETDSMPGLDSATESKHTDNDAPLGEAAQMFLDAVSALDQDAILSTANAWGLAHRAWEQDKENAVRKAALDEAVTASDEAAASLYAAEDLFYMIPEDEQNTEEVQAAFTVLMSLFATMHEKMDNPTAPTEPTEPGTEGGDEPPAEDEIAAILYGDLPDAPTGSYMGSYGLPVATGETKIGIGAWTESLLSDTVYRLDADALNSDGASIVAPLQEGKDYAIIPILTQVEYPANGSSSTVILPDGVTLLSQDGSGEAASAEESAAILNAAYNESSAAVSGFFVRASEDFAVRFVYTAPDGTTLEKTLDIHIDKNSTQDVVLYGLPVPVSTYAERPTPAVTTGKVTRVEKVNGTWLVWFNGEPAYCCDHGKWAAPANCPTYTYSHTSIVAGSQYTPGDHYKNQVEIWGGLGQLSLRLLHQDGAALFSTDDANACYDDAQRWVMEHYPDSVAAKAYQNAVNQLTGGAVPYATASDYYCCATCSVTSL